MISEQGWGFTFVGGPATGGITIVLRKSVVLKLMKRDTTCMKRWLHEGAQIQTSRGDEHTRPNTRPATPEEIDKVRNIIHSL